MVRKVYGKQRVNKEVVETEKNSIVFWLLISFVVLFLFWAPFQKGLFNGNTFDFERPVYNSLVWISIIMLLLSIYFFFKWKLRDHRDALSVLVFLLPLTYLISLLSAASHHYAFNMLFIQVIFAVFFILGVYLSKNKLGYSIISGALFASSYVIVLFGLLNLFGSGHFAGALVGWFTNLENGIYMHAVMTDANGIRLTSVFQYANSYAAYLIAVLLLSSFHIVKSDKWYMIGIHAFMTVPVIISFWLTLSRGAIVIWPAVLLVILFFLTMQKQILLLVQLGLAFIASFTVLGKITAAGTLLQNRYNPSQSGSAWLLLLTASLTYTAAAILIQKYVAPWLESKLQRFEGRKFTAVILPLTAVIAGLIAVVLLFSDTGLKNLLPANIQTRLENINFAQHSVLERGTFYADAIKLWKDYPVIGAGGGAWAALYEKYQNNPYISRQAHNFFLQYLVETGALGLLVFLAFLAAVVYFFIKSWFHASQERRSQYLTFFIVVVSLLFHSIIDFDLSYVYLGALLFLSFGGMIAFTNPFPMKFDIEKAAVHKIYPASLLLLSIVLFIFSVKSLSSNSAFITFQKMLATNPSYNELVVPIDRAIQLSPNDPDYIIGYSSGTGHVPGKVTVLDQLYSQTKDGKYLAESENLIASLKQKEPHNRGVVSAQFNHFLIRGQVQEALALINSELPNFPWQIDLYEKSMTLAADLGSQAKAQGNLKEMETYTNGALEAYKNVLYRIELLKNLPKEQNQGQQFDVTKQISFAMGEVYFMRGDYGKSVELLKPIVSDQMDDQQNRVAARYYLAALNMQKQNDSALYDMLVAQDPSEKQQILALIASANKKS
jgi:tetratricopeptide (TPR) repeat protein